MLPLNKIALIEEILLLDFWYIRLKMSKANLHTLQPERTLLDDAFNDLLTNKEYH